MSLIPAFHIGWTNAWILMLIFWLNWPLIYIVDKLLGVRGLYKKMGDMPSGKEEVASNLRIMAVLVLLSAYSVFLPLKLGTGWFYAGLILYLVGVAMLALTIVNIAVTPEGQVRTSGLYRYSRHPAMLSQMVIMAGVGVASASWIVLLLTVVLQVLQHYQAVIEERGCLETFGDAYQQYMESTPRWLRLPKSR